MSRTGAAGWRIFQRKGMGNRSRDLGTVEDRGRSSVKLVDVLQGKWLGHPLHPAIVHVPIGGWLAACALDLIALAGGRSPALGQLTLWLVGVGLIAALAAVPPGLADWSAIKKEKPAWKIGLYHMLLNLLATLIWAVNFGLRWTHRSEASAATAMPVVVTSLTGTLLVLISAYLGSLMVFDHGIGVARTSKKKWRQVAARAGARLPDEK
jgi:uncharacterized membrane protein